MSKRGRVQIFLIIGDMRSIMLKKDFIIRKYFWPNAPATLTLETRRANWGHELYTGCTVLSACQDLVHLSDIQDMSSCERAVYIIPPTHIQMHTEQRML
jgi:hypothetical protein